MRKYLGILGLLLVFIGVYVLSHAGDAPKDYNVIVIAFDGLQAKHLRAYGYPLPTTPNLDAFFKNAYLFTNTVSAASWTVPSFMSMFTSLYPSEHKVVNKFIEQRTASSTVITRANLKELNPEAETLATILKRHGYTTGGFTGDAGVSASFGYGEGFDVYYDQETFGGFDESIPRALAWLTENKDKKFFLFVHGYDVHGQHVPTDGLDYRYVTQPYSGIYTGSPSEQAGIRERGLAEGNVELSSEDVAFWRALYDEKINRADADFGNFLQEIERLGILNETIVVTLSDHGTEFYEHKRFDHGHTLYGELLNTLFAIHTPEQEEGREIPSLVSTLDLAPTLLSILNIRDRAQNAMRGIDLTPSFFGEDVSRDIYSETDYRLYTHKRSVTTPDGWKFILTMETLEKELYDLTNDPKEQENLIAQETERGNELEKKLYRHMKEVGDAGPWTLGCSPVYADQCQENN